MSEPLQAVGPIRRHAGRLHSIRVRMAPGLEMSGHRHDQPTIVIVAAGELHVSEAGDTVREPAGTVRLCPANTTRTVSTMDGAECVIISSEPSSPVARHAIWKRLPADRSSRYALPVAHARILAQSGTSEMSEPFEAACLALLTALGRETESTAGRPAWLDEALEELAKTGGRKGACRDVARALDLHPVHLARVVRRFTGLTIRDYLRRDRVLRGSRMLRESGESVSRVAHDAGFADHSHFTREFHHRYGHAPSTDVLTSDPDVVSIQAPAFPDVHLGQLTGRDEWAGEAASKD